MEYLLYDKTVLLTFSPGAHRYRVSFKEGDNWSKSRPTTGVTTIQNFVNKPALVPWSAKLSAEKYAKEVKKLLKDNTKITASMLDELVGVAKNAPSENRDKAGDLGTKIHSLIEDFHGGREVKTDEETELPVNAYIKDFEASGEKILMVEQPVYSLKYDYAGTFDKVVETPTGKKILDDNKTTKVSKWAPDGVYIENFAQLGGYAQCLKEMFDWYPDVLRVTNVGKDGVIRKVTNEDFGMSVEDALHYWNTIHTAWYTNKDWEFKFKRS